MRKNRRILLIAVPLAVILFGLAVYQYMYVGVRTEITAIREQQDVKMATLSKYINLIAQKPELEKQLAALREQAKGQDVKLISGDPISLASANLQALVKGVVSGRGGTISSERIGKPEELEKAPTLPGVAAVPAAKAANGKKVIAPAVGAQLQVLSISMDSILPDTSALSDILYSLETRTPYIGLKELDVRVRNFREPRDLMVRIDATGLYEGK
ncbi:MAG: hypothetical protein ACLPN1_02160 [Dissulfurispiraceae bacterium]